MTKETEPSRLRNAVKQAGKALAYIAAPPLTYVLSTKETDLSISKAMKLAGLCLGISFAYDTVGTRDIFREGETRVTRSNYSTGVFDLTSSIWSPIYHTLRAKDGIQIGSKITLGESLIFDKKSRKYSANINENTPMRQEGTLSFSSLKEEKEALNTAMASGDLEDIKKAKSKFDDFSKFYAETQKEFTEAAQRMNSRLEQLSEGIK
jgi:hypothetical protein